jgi:hypothetical protein
MFKKSDRIAVEFAGEESFTLYFSPLTMAEKTMFVQTAGKTQQDPMAMLEFAKAVLGATLKSCKGIKLGDGSDYAIEIVDGKVSDACLDDLMNLDCAGKVITVATKFISGVPSNGMVLDMQGQVLEGVTVKKS